jgi:hypothetical protein
MELLLARAVGAQALGMGAPGDMVLTGMVGLPQGGEVRYIIDSKMDTTGRGRAETKSPGVRSKIYDLVEEGERVIHATLWANANGRVKGAGLFRFFEGFRSVGWRKMEPLTEVSDMNDLARPAKLAAFREAVLARLRKTDVKSYNAHVSEVARLFVATGVDDGLLGCLLIEKKQSKQEAEQLREEVAAKFLGMSVAELRRRLAGGKP